MSLIKHQIIGTKEISHIFTSEDEGYTTMGAYITDSSGEEKRVAWVDIEVLPQSTPPPTVIETMGSFPTGTSTDNLVLIYHEDKNYVKDLVVTDLNTYARNYLISIGEVEENDSQNITYFSEDVETKEIYTILKLPEGSPEYDNEYYNKNERIIKVYVKGAAEIIGYEYGTVTPQNEEIIQVKETTQDDYGIQLSPGYCCVIGNVIYMFILTKACLVNIDTEEDGFCYRGENMNTSKKYFQDFSEQLVNNGYYLYKGVVCKDLKIKAPKEVNENNILPEEVDVVFQTGEIKYFVTAQTMTEIEYFANIANAKSINLLGIKKIGDYSFYGSNVSGNIFSEAGNLEEIGKYAFAKTSNLDYETGQLSMTTLPINLIKIDDYAFKGSMGLDKVDFSSCTKLETVGKQAFADCGNLTEVHYNASQVKWNGDENKPQILYLPPECQMEGAIYKHAPRENSEEDITINGPYYYEYNNELNGYNPDNPDISKSQYFTEHEKNNSLKTFLGDSRIFWSCQGE